MEEFSYYYYDNNSNKFDVHFSNFDELKIINLCRNFLSDKKVKNKDRSSFINIAVSFIDKFNLEKNLKEKCEKNKLTEVVKV